MKQVVLAAMVMMTMAGSASAETNAWDYFWGTTVSQGLDPKLNGWDDFWGQCQNPERTEGDCIGTVVVGIGMIAALPIIALTISNTVGTIAILSPYGLLGAGAAGSAA